MNAVAYLRANGERTAGQVAAAMGLTMEATYVELVRAESRGLVRINVEGQTHRTWEAMDERTSPSEARS